MRFPKDIGLGDSPNCVRHFKTIVYSFDKSCLVCSQNDIHFNYDNGGLGTSDCIRISCKNIEEYYEEKAIYKCISCGRINVFPEVKIVKKGKTTSQQSHWQSRQNGFQAVVVCKSCGSDNVSTDSVLQYDSPVNFNKVVKYLITHVCDIFKATNYTNISEKDYKGKEKFHPHTFESSGGYCSHGVFHG